jgi:hypothetical protein
MGTIFVPYPYPNREIPHGLSGIGSPCHDISTTDAAGISLLAFLGQINNNNNESKVRS